MQILKHDWLVKEGVALTAELDSVVLQRMRQFAQMNKLKKMALMVVGQNLSPDELSGGCHIMYINKFVLGIDKSVQLNARLHTFQHSWARKPPLMWQRRTRLQPAGQWMRCCWPAR